jgi:hypothetical protein
MKEELRSVIQRGAFTQASEYDLAQMLHMMPQQWDSSNSSSGVTRGTLDITMCVRRRAGFWAYNVWVPLFCFTGISLSSFAVDVESLSDRLAITITILLTLVAYRFAIMDRLPSVDYLTLLDLYIQLCFGVVFAVTIAAVALNVQADIAFERTGTSVAIPWQTSQRRTLWATSIAWLSVNAAIMPCTFLARRWASTRFKHLRWWDSSDNLLWLGGEPICQWQEKLVDKGHQRGDLENAILKVLQLSEMTTQSNGACANGCKRKAMPGPAMHLVSITLPPDKLKPHHTGGVLKRNSTRIPMNGDQERLEEVVKYQNAKHTTILNEVLPESANRWVLLEFATPEHAKLAKRVLTEALSTECDVCWKENGSGEKLKPSSKRQTSISDTFVSTPRRMALALRLSMSGKARSSSGTAEADVSDTPRSQAEEAAPPSPLVAALEKVSAVVCQNLSHRGEGKSKGDDAKKTSKVCSSCAKKSGNAEQRKRAADITVVCEPALPEYKSLLVPQWRAWWKL